MPSSENNVIEDFFAELNMVVFRGNENAKNHIFKTKAILELMGAEKDLRKINSHLPRDGDYNKSRLEEKTKD